MNFPDIVFCDLKYPDAKTKARLVYRHSTQAFTFSINNGNESGWIVIHENYKGRTPKGTAALADINTMIGTNNHIRLIQQLNQQIDSITAKIEAYRKANGMPPS